MLELLDSRELFGAYVRFRRTEAGWNKSHLASKVEVNSTSIARIENGDMSPALPTLRRLADAFGESVDSFCAGALQWEPEPKAANG